VVGKVLFEHKAITDNALRSACEYFATLTLSWERSAEELIASRLQHPDLSCIIKHAARFDNGSDFAERFQGPFLPGR
jgi:hypothetical protein